MLTAWSILMASPYGEANYELSRRIAHFGGCRQRLRCFDGAPQGTGARPHLPVEGDESGIHALGGDHMDCIRGTKNEVETPKD